MDKRSNKYTIEELLLDDYFISSTLHPSEESREFWEFLIQRGNVSIDDFKKASLFVKAVQSRKDKLFRKEKETLWSKIEVENKNTLKKKIRTLYATSVSAAACIVLLLGISVYLYYTGNSENKNINTYAELKERPVLNPGGDICLILSDEKHVTFEENTAEVKYDTKGEVKVNSQTVAKEEKEAIVRYNQLIVPKGKHSTLLLSDGSKLWINAGSHVIFPVELEGDKREIYVDGEVFLDVARDEARPFVVKTDRMHVQVLGTSFNVKSYSDQSIDDIVLVTGAVHVQTESGEKAELIPNQRFSCTPTGKAHIETVDVYDYISWKDGLLQYKREPFPVILQRLSDYYGKPIQWDPALDKLTCSGKLDLKDDMEKVLTGLTKMIPVKFTKQSDCYFFSMNP